jgi:hypothetical protein
VGTWGSFLQGKAAEALSDSMMDSEAKMSFGKFSTDIIFGKMGRSGKLLHTANHSNGNISKNFGQTGEVVFHNNH